MIAQTAAAAKINGRSLHGCRDADPYRPVDKSPTPDGLD
jgi:hypothetical protein